MAFSQTFMAGVDALGAVLLHFLWQGAGLGLIYLLLRPLCPRVGARYHLGMGMLLALATCPVLTIVYLWPAGGGAASTASGMLNPALTGSIAAVAGDAISTVGLRRAAALAGGDMDFWRSRHRPAFALALAPAGAAGPQRHRAAGLGSEAGADVPRFGLLRPVRLLASARSPRRC